MSFLLYNMEGGRSGYTSLLKRSSWFCRLFPIMKSPGSSCAAAIVMFDQLTSKVRARIFSFVFPSQSLKAGIKACQRTAEVGCVMLYLNSFNYASPTLHSTVLIQGRRVLFLFTWLSLCLIWLFFTNTRRFSRSDFLLGVTLKPSCRSGQKNCGRRRQVWRGEGRVFTEGRGLWVEMKRLPAEHADQSVMAQPQTWW